MPMLTSSGKNRATALTGPISGIGYADSPGKLAARVCVAVAGEADQTEMSMKATMRIKLLAGLAVAIGLSGWASAQVFDQLPNGALVVLKVNHIGDTSKKISAFMKETGLAVRAPAELADPIGSLQKEAGIDKGLDMAGEAAFAFIDPKISGAESTDKSMVLLVPVTSYDDFITNFKDAKTDGAITEGATPKGDPIFIVKAGKYACISPSKAVAGLKPAGLKVAGVTARELGSRDAIIYANFVALRDDLQKQLATGRRTLRRSLKDEMGSKPDGAKNLPVATAAVDQLVNIADSFLRDADSAILGVSFTPAGLGTTLMAEFKQGSYIGSLVASMPNTDKPLVYGLPEEKYLVWGGTTLDAVATTKLFNDLIAPIMVEVEKMESGKTIGKAVDAYRAMITAYSGGSFGLIAPTGALGQSSLIQGIGVIRGDAAKLRVSYKALVESQQELMKAMGLPGGMETAYTPNAKTVDGVAFDQMTTKMGEPNTPEEQQIAQMMMFMYGPGGPAALLGVIDEKTILTAMGVDEAKLSPAITAAKAGIDPFGKLAHVQAVAGELPRKRIVEVYIALDNIISTGMNYAGMFLPIRVKLPANLPPIGQTIATDGSAVRVDTHVPSKLIKAIVDATMQAMQQMQDGPNGGGQPPMNPDGL